MDSEESKKRSTYSTTMETTFGANSASTGVRARGRSFQEGEFHSPPGSEKSRQSFSEDSMWRHRRNSNVSACSSYPSLNSNLSNSDSDKVHKVSKF